MSVLNSVLVIDDILSNVESFQTFDLKQYHHNPSYPLNLWINQKNKRIAYSEVVFSLGQVERFDKIGEVIVESGMIGMGDHIAAHEYKELIKKLRKEKPYFNLYDSFWETKVVEHYGVWGKHKFTNGATIFLFEAGFGDGIYPVYQTTDKHEEAVSLIIGMQD
ncbi:MAG: DUF4241 domain-containing protein [Bacillota bacterium]